MFTDCIFGSLYILSFCDDYVGLIRTCSKKIRNTRIDFFLRFGRRCDDML